MLSCSPLCDAERSTKHSSQPQPSEPVRVGQSGDFRIPLGSLIHNGFLHVQTRVRACRSGFLAKVAEHRQRGANPCLPCQALGGPDDASRERARESIHHPGDCCTGCMASWHSAPHTRAACLRAQTSSIWVPTAGLGTHVSDHRDCVYPRLRYSWLRLGYATQVPFAATLCR